MRRNLFFFNLLFALIFLYPEFVFSKQLTFFLIDKSSSMWAVHEKNGLPILQAVKDKVEAVMKKASFDWNWSKNKVYLVIFDSDVDMMRIRNFKDAKDDLKEITPGNKANIGDCFNQVGMAVTRENPNPEKVTIHFFSGIKKDETDKKNIQAGIESFVEVLKKFVESQSEIIIYSWKNWPENRLFDKFVNPKLKIKEEPIDQKFLRAIFDYPTIDEIIYRIDSDSQTITLEPIKGLIKGFLDKEFKENDIGMTIQAEIANPSSGQTWRLLMAPDSSDMNATGNKQHDPYNYEEILEIEPESIDEYGRFAIPIKIKIDKELLPRLKRSFGLSGNSVHLKMNFMPMIKTIDNLKFNYIDYPVEKEVEVKVTCMPNICVKVLDADKERDGKIEVETYKGEVVEVPIRLEWNEGAVGKTLFIKPPVETKIFSDSDGILITITQFELDDSGYKDLIFYIDEARTMKREELILRMSESSLSKIIPVTVNASLPCAIIKLSEMKDIQVSSSVSFRQACMIFPARGAISVVNTKDRRTTDDRTNDRKARTHPRRSPGPIRCLAQCRQKP